MALQRVGKLFRGQGGTGTGLKALARERHNSTQAKRCDRRLRGFTSLRACVCLWESCMNRSTIPARLDACAPHSAISAADGCE